MCGVRSMRSHWPSAPASRFRTSSYEGPSVHRTATPPRTVTTRKATPGHVADRFARASGPCGDGRSSRTGLRQMRCERSRRQPALPPARSLTYRSIRREPRLKMWVTCCQSLLRLPGAIRRTQSPTSRSPTGTRVDAGSPSEARVGVALLVMIATVRGRVGVSIGLPTCRLACRPRRAGSTARRSRLAATASRGRHVRFPGLEGEDTPTLTRSLTTLATHPARDAGIADPSSAAQAPSPAVGPRGDVAAGGQPGRLQRARRRGQQQEGHLPR